MSRPKQYGICHICGKYRKLSFEHVPPQKAYNNEPAHMAKGEEFIRNITKANFEDIKTRIYQRGSGGYTLCEKCNNDTGSWYGNSYLDWVYQAASIIHYTSGKPTLHYPYFIFPQRVIKQIVCMFFSANGPEFRKLHPELVKFVLNREHKYIEDSLRIYCYYNPTYVGRQTGVSIIANTKGEFESVSEISFFPFGYLMTIESKKQRNNILDITFFSKYEYNDWVDLTFQIPCYSIATWFPGDFRTKEEVKQTIEYNRKHYSKRNRKP